MPWLGVNTLGKSLLGGGGGGVNVQAEKQFGYIDMNWWSASKEHHSGRASRTV